MQTLTSLPQHRKPRERLLEAGSEPVTATELIAVLLGTGGSGFGVMEVAEKVRNCLANGSVSPADLQTVPGVGLSKALRITAALKLQSTVEQENVPESLHDPEAVFRAMEDIRSLPQEHLAAFFLSVRQTKLRREIISIGTLSASLLHPREVFRPAITSNAACLVLAHNHPSGIAEPSTADLRVTREMAEAGKTLGIKLLDHVICTTSSHVSLKSRYPDLFLDRTAVNC